MFHVAAPQRIEQARFRSFLGLGGGSGFASPQPEGKLSDFRTQSLALQLSKNLAQAFGRLSFVR